jgi:hypothetical protein
MKKIACLVVLVLFGASTYAEPLNASVVERWLGSQADVKAWGEQHEDAFEPRSSASALAVKDFIEPLKQAGLYPEMQGLLRGHGFESPEHWAQATVQIVSAYAKTQMSSEAMAMSPDDMRAKLQQVEDSPHLNDEQKQQMRAMLESTLAMMARIKQVPEADVQAIQPYLGQLEQVMQQNAARP